MPLSGGKVPSSKYRISTGVVPEARHIIARTATVWGKNSPVVAAGTRVVAVDTDVEEGAEYGAGYGVWNYWFVFDLWSFFFGILPAAAVGVEAHLFA